MAASSQTECLAPSPVKIARVPRASTAKRTKRSLTLNAQLNRTAREEGEGSFAARWIMLIGTRAGGSRWVPAQGCPGDRPSGRRKQSMS
jgi:hypothetical protein